jgi:VCBS repeat-containing protein
LLSDRIPQFPGPKIRRRVRPRRLFIETLEQRSMLAASITGRTFNDLNQDGVFQPQYAESPIAGQTVFLDLNGNGRLDAAEPTQVTAADGSYQFTGLAAGEYSVRQLPAAGWVPTPLAAAQANFRTIDLATNDIAYDSVHGTILAAVNWSQGAIGNSVTELNPLTGELGRSLPLNIYPAQLAVSDTGSMLYVASAFPYSILPVNLTTFTADQPFDLGTNLQGELFRPIDMAVMPGNPQALAVARRQGGVAIYDNGVMRPKTTIDNGPLVDAIEFDNTGTTIYGLDISTTARDFTRMNVTAAGVTMVQTGETDVGGGMIYENGRIYGANGRVLDPTTRTTLGTVQAAGLVVPATSRSLIFSLIGTNILAFDDASFQLIATLKLPSLPNGPGGAAVPQQLIKWGLDGLAVRLNNGTILLVDWDPRGGSYHVVVNANQATQGNDFGNLTTAAVIAPAAGGDTFNATENKPFIVSAPGVLANDTSQNGPLTAVPATGPLHGTVTLNANGSFVYTPVADYVGPDSFTYYVADGVAISSPATVSLTVAADPNAPVAANNQFSFNEDTPLTIAAPGVLANDTGPSGTALTAALQSDVKHGSLALNADGSFQYTPLPDYNGTDTFTYRAKSGDYQSHVATVTLVIRSVNDPPVAFDDNYTTPKNTTLTIAARGVLLNDVDVDTPITAVLENPPSHGTLSFSSTGAFTYYPDTDFSGTDSFTYYAKDIFSKSATPATVSLSVTPVDGTPTASNDSYSATEDTRLTISGPGVLANDSDPGGDTLTALLVAEPAHGTLTLNANGSFSYLPSTNYNGADSFTYRATDGHGNSGIATATINIANVNDPPTVNAGDHYGLQDTLLNVAAPGVLTYAKDVDHDLLTAGLVNATQHGTLTLNTDGSFSYLPAAGYVGTDSFGFQVSDGQSLSGLTSVLLHIEAFSDIPIAVDDTFSFTEDYLPDGPSYYVLGNDTDANRDPLKAILVSTTSHGQLILNRPNDSSGTFSYQPDPNFYGQDSFTYRATDGVAESNIATVTLNVLPVDDPPTARSDSYSTREGMPLVVGGDGVLGNDTDIDTPQLTGSLVRTTAHGKLDFNADGTFTYTPDAGFSGTDTFVYGVRDRQPLPAALYGISYDFRQVGDPAQLFSIAVSSATAALVTTFEGFSDPMGLAFVPDGRLLSYSLVNLEDLNPANGVVALIDANSTPNTLEGDLAFNPKDGLLYAAGATFDGIIKINPLTGARTAVGNAGAAGSDISGLAFDSAGVLYGIAMMGTQPDMLVTINTATGVATAIGPTGTNGIYSVAGMAFDPATGKLYLSVDFNLYTVNTSTGAATLVGNIGYAGAPSNSSVGFITGLSFPLTGPQSTATLSIEVTPVNDAPSFTRGGDVAATDEDALTTIPGWATSLTAGPADEAAQHLHFVLTIDRPELFAVQPAIAPDGTLTFQPQANSSGTATATVTLVDDGGTANGGSDTSVPQTLVIDIAKPHVWHNSAMPCDVDHDSHIAPGDALAVINRINLMGSGPVAKDVVPGDFYYDVNRDQYVAPSDALMVINYLNAHPSQPSLPAGEGEAAVDASLLLYLLENAPDAPRRNK